MLPVQHKRQSVAHRKKTPYAVRADFESMHCKTTWANGDTVTGQKLFNCILTQCKTTLLHISSLSHICHLTKGILFTNSCPSVFNCLKFNGLTLIALSFKNKNKWNNSCHISDDWCSVYLPKIHDLQAIQIVTVCLQSSLHTVEFDACQSIHRVGQAKCNPFRKIAL